MIKKLTLVFALLAILISVFAQSPSFFSPSGTNEPAATNPKIMSPEEFQKAVAEKGQENLDKINQELKQQHMQQSYPAPLAQKPIAPPPTMPPAGGSSTTTTTTTTPQNLTPPPPVVQKNTAPASAPAAAPPTTAQQPLPAQAPPANIPPPPNQYGVQQEGIAPNQPQTYMGFGSGQENKQQTTSPKSNTSNTGTGGNTGGWNIKY